jgi:hypothetical protein
MRAIRADPSVWGSVQWDESSCRAGKSSHRFLTIQGKKEKKPPPLLIVLGCAASQPAAAAFFAGRGHFFFCTTSANSCSI